MHDDTRTPESERARNMVVPLVLVGATIVASAITTAVSAFEARRAPPLPVPALAATRAPLAAHRGPAAAAHHATPTTTRRLP